MATIKEELLNGILWTAISRYSGLLISIVVSMILARLISPNEFGIVAIANIFIVFLTMFSQMGIAPAIIQYSNLSTSDYNNIFSVSIYLGTILVFAFYLLSWPIASIYSEPSLLGICHILTINVFFSAINMVPNALMQKNKRFKDLAKVSLIIQFISGALSVCVALVGGGIYSLVISPIFLSAGLFLYCRHEYPVKFCLLPSFHSVRKILSYSIYQFCFEFINYFSRNLDKLIIGKMISINALGYYEKSYTLVQMPQQYITGIINPVLQPVLCKLEQEPNELCHNYTKIISIISMLSFPIGIILCFCSKEIILLMFGAQWVPAIKVLQIISLSLPTQMILSTSGAIWQASNSTKLMFWVGSFNTFIVVIGFIVSAYFYRNIEAVALSWTLSAIFTFAITYYIMYKRCLNSSIMHMLKILVNPLVCAIILAMFYSVYNSCVVIQNVVVLLASKLFLGGILTLLYLHITRRINIINFIKQI